MLAHLRAVFPQEGCGFLAGVDGWVNRVFPVDNILGSPTAYRMDPRQQVEALLAIEEAGLAPLAIYHSHPAGSAALSAADVAQITFPALILVVVALARSPAGTPVVHEVRAYAFGRAGRSSTINEVDLKIV